MHGKPTFLLEHFVQKLQERIIYVRFEVLAAMTMKNALFWDVTQCESCNNRRLGKTYLLYNQAYKNRWKRNNVSRN
jgi:hypothetical protein